MMIVKFNKKKDIFVSVMYSYLFVVRSVLPVICKCYVPIVVFGEINNPLDTM